MILIGTPEPPEGWLLEEIEAALYQAEVTGRVMHRSDFVQPVGRPATPDDLGAMM
jgi:hypothetical protein